MTPLIPSRRSAVLLTTLFHMGLAGALLAVGFEWKHYAKLLGWGTQHLDWWEKATLFGCLWAKTLWVMSPLAALSCGLAWRGRGRLAAVAMAGNTALVASWLLLNLRVQHVTGNHIHTYFTFLASDEALAWAGRTSIVALLRPARIVLAITILAAGLSVARHFIHRAALACTPRWTIRAAIVTFLVIAAIAVGAVPAARTLDRLFLLEAFADALPVPARSLLVPRSRAELLTTFRESFREATQGPLRPISDAILNGQPIDTELRLDVPNPPNVYLIIIESLRADVLSEEHMPQLHRWADRGMRFLRHYAGSNASQFGMFAVLYGRSPMVYHLTLDAKLPPQLTTTFRKSGYRCTYLSGGTLPWVRMEEFLNESTFDEVRLFHEREWADRDRCALRRLQGMTRDNSTQPRLNVVFLVSSHYDYDYPKEYERHLPVVPRNIKENTSRQYREMIFNRYRNSLAFLDDEIANLIARLDPDKNIIVVTGDHGESFLDDGVFWHNSKGSDAQTRVPLAIVGPGVPRMTISSLTRHADIVPTLLHLVAGKQVPLRHSHGTDVLADGGRDWTAQFTAPRATEGYRLLLLHGDERFRVRVVLGRDPDAEAEGYYDINDKLQVDHIPGQADVGKWRDVLLRELALMAN